MSTRMSQRRGTASEWAGLNPVLNEGEIGFEIDTNKFKIGDGSKAWNALSYFYDYPTIETYVDSQISNVTVDLSTSAGVGLDWNSGTSQFDIDSTVATKTYADTAASNAAAAIVDAAPETLNTLNELAAAINDDSSYAATITTTLGQKAPLDSPTFTGTVDFTGATVTGIPIPDPATPVIRGTVYGRTLVDTDNADYGNVGLGYGVLSETDPEKIGWAVGIGYQALNSGWEHVAIGYQALNHSTEWSAGNVAIGTKALFDAYDSSNNVAVGNTALYSAGNVNNSVAIGAGSQYHNYYGDGNVSVGSLSLYNLTEGMRNVALGQITLYNLTTGDYNIAVGHFVGNNLTTGNHNIILGNNAAGSISSGNYNISIGQASGSLIGDGSNNILIGKEADVSTSSASNEIVLGNSSITRFAVPGLGIDWNSLTVPKDGSYHIVKTGSLSGGSSSLTISEISSTYNEYLVVFSNLDHSDDANNRDIWITLNNDSSSSYYTIGNPTAYAYALGGTLYGSSARYYAFKVLNANGANGMPKIIDTLSYAVQETLWFGTPVTSIKITTNGAPSIVFQGTTNYTVYGK